MKFARVYIFTSFVIFLFEFQCSLDPKNQFRILPYIHTFEALLCKVYLEFAFNLVFSCILLYILQKMENAKIVHSIKPLSGTSGALDVTICLCVSCLAMCSYV